MNYIKKDLLFSLGIFLFPAPHLVIIAFFQLMLAVYLKLNSSELSINDMIASEFVVTEKIVIPMYFSLVLFFYIYLQAARQAKSVVFKLQYVFLLPSFIAFVFTVYLIADFLLKLSLVADVFNCSGCGLGYFFGIPGLAAITVWMFIFFKLIQNKTKQVFGKQV